VGPTGTQDREAVVHHPEPSATLLVPGLVSGARAQARDVSPAHPCRPGRHSKPGNGNNLPCPSSWSNLGGRRTRGRAVGMGKVCSARWMRSTARDGSRGRNCALLWGMRVNCRSSKLGPAAAQAKEAKAIDDHIKRVQA
jgi:hypothetical protein